MKKFDVIVCGAGPSGASAAYILSKNKINTLIIDKDIFPRQKCCAGGLTEKTVSLLKNVFKIQEEEFHNIIDHKIYHYDLRYKGKCVKKNKSKYPYYFVDRKNFDFFLLKKAIECGVIFHENEYILSIDHTKKIVKTNKGIYQANNIICSIGAFYKQSKLVPEHLYNKEKREKKTIFALQSNVLNKDFKNYSNRSILFDFGIPTRGYGWIFPGKKSSNIGIGGIYKKENIIDYMKYVQRLYLKDNINIQKKGAFLPFGYFLKKPYHKNTLFSGDTGGFTESLFGEGIYYAILTGFLGALSIIKDKQNPSKHYKKYIKEYFYSEFYLNMIISDIFYFILKFGKHTFLKICIDTFENIIFKLAHGKIFKTQQKLLQELHQHM